MSAGPTPLQARILKLAEQHAEQWHRDNARPLRELAELRAAGKLPDHVAQAGHLDPETIHEQREESGVDSFNDPV